MDINQSNCLCGAGNAPAYVNAIRGEILYAYVDKKIVTGTFILFCKRGKGTGTLSAGRRQGIEIVMEF